MNLYNCISIQLSVITNIQIYYFYLINAEKILSNGSLKSYILQ